MELQTSKVDLLLDVDQKPELVPGLFLSLQHVFAMFGATVLVPLILGMPVSVAAVCNGANGRKSRCSSDRGSVSRTIVCGSGNFREVIRNGMD